MTSKSLLITLTNFNTAIEENSYPLLKVVSSTKYFCSCKELLFFTGGEFIYKYIRVVQGEITRVLTGECGTCVILFASKQSSSVFYSDNGPHKEAIGQSKKYFKSKVKSWRKRFLKVDYLLVNLYVYLSNSTRHLRSNQRAV